MNEQTDYIDNIETLPPEMEDILKQLEQEAADLVAQVDDDIDVDADDENITTSDDVVIDVRDVPIH